ncbi:MAG: BON domain-containing protein [Gemmatimonadaceae bacterium]|nr:BON domain-containing protein [Gemmatimonadaceae bacterium]
MRISRTSRSLHTLRRSGASNGGTLALVALGAVAGLALGMALADRFGGVDGLARRAGLKSRKRHKTSGWRGDARRSQHFDDLADDDSELAPEAMSHLHFAHDHHDHADEDAADFPESVEAPSDARRAIELIPTAEELEHRVLEAFGNDPMLMERSIDISSDGDGTIELTGWVTRPSEMDYAVTIARGVPGVHQVINALVLRSSATG